MGAMGFIHSAETEIMRNSMLVNLNTVEAAARSSVTKYFFASSVCVYRDMKIGEPAIAEDAAYPGGSDDSILSHRQLRRYRTISDPEIRSVTHFLVG
jgi:GDP-D-mannose 3', 5'-epimerase